MAAYASQAYSHAAAPGAVRYNAPAGIPPATGPPGTFAPGTKVQVGSHRVVIEKYLSEGGFAHVYVVRLPKPVDGEDLAVLKRVAVPDKDHLANMRTEVETMKKLKGHRNIVTYFDSHASQLKGGGYEVFLLMEFCSGGGLIDFMNTRLQHRLTEPEILHIFSDLAEGVATMHYLKPPLLHRDLKVENVLISTAKGARVYKVCDFGSTAPPRPAATTAAEGRLIEDDIQKHTTLQYRSPEMIDVYRRQPIDEKSDIWAMGVLLYKLCYYTTPFEEVGQMAILNASFKFPSYPRFSDRLKLLIASMLMEHPAKRPNIYQVMTEVCSMRHKPVPIKDIYSNRTASEARRNQELPPSPSDPRPRVGAVFSPPVQEPTIKIPDIAPMRRGRPTQPVSQHASAKGSPSPFREVNQADPFAALDGGRTKGADELSNRFPKLDEFSLLQDSGKKFEFEQQPSGTKPANEDLSERVTKALADDAFARLPSKKERPPSEEGERPISVAEHKKALESKPAPPRQDIPLSQPAPQRPGMVSTGTMTSPSPPITTEQSIDKRPVQRFPPAELQKRPSSQPWADRLPLRMNSFSKGSNPNLPSLNPLQLADRRPRSPASSRPSLEVSRPPLDDIEAVVNRSRSHESRRPKSMQVPPKPEALSRRSPALGPADLSSTRQQYDQGNLPDVLSGETDNNITSDMEFLRAREEEESERKQRDKRMSSGSYHVKRASLPSISMQGTKNLLAGRFGDAFRKFEAGRSGQKSRSPSPSRDREHLNVLTPISGSVATGSDDEHVLEEAEDSVSPEVRRELERRRLSMEEKRVANAAAEYKKRLVSQGDSSARGVGVSRAQSIQNKVQSLLKENERPATKTATGYGRFTDSGNAVPQVQQSDSLPPQPSVERAPVAGASTLREVPGEKAPGSGRPTSSQTSTIVSPAPKVGPQRPLAPPKPKTLRTGQADLPSTRQPSINADYTPMSPNEDWEVNFNKRYPSLSGLEMVETEIDRPKSTAPIRVKEV